MRTWSSRLGGRRSYIWGREGGLLVYLFVFAGGEGIGFLSFIIGCSVGSYGGYEPPAK